MRTYDAQGKESPWSADARFGTAALDPSDWKASWIGDATPAPRAKPARNGYHSSCVPTIDAQPWIQLDLGEKVTFDEIRLYPAHPHDQKSDEAFLFPVGVRVWGSDEPAFERPPFKLFELLTYWDKVIHPAEIFLASGVATFLFLGYREIHELEIPDGLAAAGAHVITADEASITVETHVLGGEAFAPVAERRFPRATR